MKLVFHKFKRRHNKRYNYTPRYYKGKEIDNPYEIDSKFQKYHDQKNAIDFGAQWKEDRDNSRNRGNREINRRLIYIILILVFLFLWLIDFDLSIFAIPFDSFR